MKLSSTDIGAIVAALAFLGGLKWGVLSLQKDFRQLRQDLKGIADIARRAESKANRERTLRIYEGIRHAQTVEQCREHAKALLED